MVNVSGGKAEIVMRTLHKIISGKEMSDMKITALRGSKGIKETRIKIGKLDIGVAVVNGMGNFQKLMQEIEAGRNDLHYVEVMACPNGCISGGGQPIGNREDAVKLRAKGIYDSDDKESFKAPHQNEQVEEIYKNYYGVPFDPKNFGTLHSIFKQKRGFTIVVMSQKILVVDDDPVFIKKARELLEKYGF